MPLTAKEASVNRTLSPLRYLDVAVIVVAAIPALALGAPVFGYIVGVGSWVLQRVFQSVDRRFLEGHAKDPVRATLLILGESFGRIWFLAGGILLAALAGNHSDGLTCAVIIFAAYTVNFVIRLINGATEAAARQAATPSGAVQPRS